MNMLVRKLALFSWLTLPMTIVLLSGQAEAAHVLPSGAALDKTFNHRGSVRIPKTTRFPSQDVEEISVAPDGSVYALTYAGRVELAREPDFPPAPVLNAKTWSISRFTRSGRFDRSFGRKGILRPPGGTWKMDYPSFRADRAGRLLTTSVGKSPKLKRGARIYLRRFLRSGSLDRQFGHRGRAHFDLAQHPEGITEMPTAIARNGDIWLVNQYGKSVDVARVSHSGRLIFSVTMRRASTHSIDDIRVAPLPDGSAIVGTTEVRLNASDSVVAFSKLKADGQVDPAWAEGGYRILDSRPPGVKPSKYEEGYSLDALGASATGAVTFAYSGSWTTWTARFTDSGAIDSTYGSAGSTLLPTRNPNGLNGYLYYVVPADDGTMLFFDTYARGTVESMRAGRITRQGDFKIVMQNTAANLRLRFNFDSQCGSKAVPSGRYVVGCNSTVPTLKHLRQFSYLYRVAIPGIRK